MQTISIFDTTLRDGEQSPGAAMTSAARLRIARMLDAAGTDTIEAGFPAASSAIARSVAQISGQMKDARVAALARCLESDIDLAWESVSRARRPRIHVFIATSQLHIEHKLRSTQQAVLERAVAAVTYARQRCDDIEFSAEDATRSDPEFLARIFAATIAAGASTINVPDTVGYTTPTEMGSLLGWLFGHVPGIDNVVVSVHTHDDLGLATANALAAVRAGARQIECTVNGIGERAGNCALEEVVVALRTRRDMFGIETRFDPGAIARISRAVATATRMRVQRNKAIVGANAFAHQSGIHQDGILKAPATYEIVDPGTVGARRSLPLGRTSGRRAIYDRAKSLGIHLDAQARIRFEETFAAFADRVTVVGDADIRRLARAAIIGR